MPNTRVGLSAHTPQGLSHRPVSAAIPNAIEKFQKIPIYTDTSTIDKSEFSVFIFILKSLNTIPFKLLLLLILCFAPTSKTQTHYGQAKKIKYNLVKMQNGLFKEDLLKIGMVDIRKLRMLENLTINLKKVLTQNQQQLISRIKVKNLNLINQ